MTAPADPVAVLIREWVAWDRAAAALGRPGGHRPTARTLEREAHAKENALAALGINSNHAHRAIATIRHQAPTWLPGGLSVPDAVQQYLNDIGHDTTPHDLKEAS